MAGCFTLLRRITRLKNVKSEIRSEDQSSYLERYSPKGSCHLDESSMSHTLAQNGRCEFCCGMHRTCKDTSSNKHDEMNLYIYIIITVDVDRINQQQKDICPPAATYMRPGAGLTIYCAVHLHRNILQRLHWPLTAMFPSGPLQHSEVLHLYRWYTHTHTPRNSGADEMK